MPSSLEGHNRADVQYFEAKGGTLTGIQRIIQDNLVDVATKITIQPESRVLLVGLPLSESDKYVLHAATKTIPSFSGQGARIFDDYDKYLTRCRNYGCDEIIYTPVPFPNPGDVLKGVYGLICENGRGEFFGRCFDPNCYNNPSFWGLVINALEHFRPQSSNYDLAFEELKKSVSEHILKNDNFESVSPVQNTNIYPVVPPLEDIVQFLEGQLQREEFAEFVREDISPADLAKKIIIVAVTKYFILGWLHSKKSEIGVQILAKGAEEVKTYVLSELEIINRNGSGIEDDSNWFIKAPDGIEYSIPDIRMRLLLNHDIEADSRDNIKTSPTRENGFETWKPENVSALLNAPDLSDMIMASFDYETTE